MGALSAIEKTLFYGAEQWKTEISGASRIDGKRRTDGNQTILVWHALASRLRRIRNMGPELEAPVAFTAPHKHAMNQISRNEFQKKDGRLTGGLILNFERLDNPIRMQTFLFRIRKLLFDR